MVLHNSLVFAILYKASHPVVVEVSTAPVQGPPKKKRKIIAHQDPPPQLQRWLTGMGKAERDRVRQVNADGRRGGHPAALSFYDEVGSERPVTIRAEGTCKSSQLSSLPFVINNMNAIRQTVLEHMSPSKLAVWHGHFRTSSISPVGWI